MTARPPATSDSPQYAWEIARLFPPQGQWTEASYLSFTESLNQLVEVVDGWIEVLEVPSKSHQKIVQYLLNQILGFLTAHQLGDAISAPYRLRLRAETFREPDIVVYVGDLSRCGERFGEGADLVVEVVSTDETSRRRDYQDKLRDYADAGVSEYWIVDPAERCLRIYRLSGGQSELAGEYGEGEEASSILLSGFRTAVGDVLRAGGI